MLRSPLVTAIALVLVLPLLGAARPAVKPVGDVRYALALDGARVGTLRLQDNNDRWEARRRLRPIIATLHRDGRKAEVKEAGVFQVPGRLPARLAIALVEAAADEAFQAGDDALADALATLAVDLLDARNVSFAPGEKSGRLTLVATDASGASVLHRTLTLQPLAR